MDPANIDVNIHPTKTEIKFENEQAIWQIDVYKRQAGVGVTADTLDRMQALVDAGADAIVIDTAHGHSMYVIERCV